MTFLVELSIKDGVLAYRTGDTLVVFPENDPEAVETIGKQQGWALDRKFVLRGEKLPFPTPVSLREALTRFCDFSAFPTYMRQTIRVGRASWRR